MAWPARAAADVLAEAIELVNPAVGDPAEPAAEPAAGEPDHDAWGNPLPAGPPPSVGQEPVFPKRAVARETSNEASKRARYSSSDPNQSITSSSESTSASSTMPKHMSKTPPPMLWGRARQLLEAEGVEPWWVGQAAVPVPPPPAPVRNAEEEMFEITDSVFMSMSFHVNAIPDFK